MTVIANDFIPVVPYQTDIVVLGVGQRTDIIVEATGKATGSYWMRSNISIQCSLPLQPYAFAAIYYPEANISATPTSIATSDNYTSCGNVCSSLSVQATAN